jgi:hypothetical protein
MTSLNQPLIQNSYINSFNQARSLKQIPIGFSRLNQATNTTRLNIAKAQPEKRPHRPHLNDPKPTPATTQWLPWEKP